MAKKKIHSKHHFLLTLSEIHGKKKKVHIIDEFENDKELFMIDLQDEFIDEEIKKLYEKLSYIKKNVREKLSKK